MAARREFSENDENKEIIESVDLIHPEIFSEEGLLSLLTQRGVPVPAVSRHNKSHLLVLFHAHMTPQPQRKYRRNRRGRVMAVVQKRRRVVADGEGVGEPSWKMQRVDHVRTVGGITAGNSPLTDRLKPPPTINKDRKVIRLGGSKSSNVFQSPESDAVVKKDSATNFITQPKGVISLTKSLNACKFTKNVPQLNDGVNKDITTVKLNRGPPAKHDTTVSTDSSEITSGGSVVEVDKQAGSSRLVLPDTADNTGEESDPVKKSIAAMSRRLDLKAARKRGKKVGEKDGKVGGPERRSQKKNLAKEASSNDTSSLPKRVRLNRAAWT